MSKTTKTTSDLPPLGHRLDFPKQFSPRRERKARPAARLNRARKEKTMLDITGRPSAASWHLMS
jgi:hypothetical protein